MERMEKRSLRKCIALMLVCAIVVCFTGCVRYNITAKVKKDGTADITILIAQIDASNMMGDASSSGEDEDDNWSEELTVDEDDGEKEAENEKEDDDRKKFEEAGWTVEDYADESKEDRKYYGFTATKTGINLDNLEEEFKKIGISDKDFSFEKKDDLYILNWDFSSNTEKVTEQGVELTMLKGYGGYMTLVLELPGKVPNQNATKVDGNTYEWDMLKLKENIHCEFSLKSEGFPAWIIGVIVGGVIIAAGVVVMLVLISKRKKIAEEAPRYETITPSAPPTAAEKLAQTSFNPAQTTGLPQLGQEPEAASGEAPSKETLSEDAPSEEAPSAGPIWAKPSDGSEIDSLDDLDQ